MVCVRISGKHFGRGLPYRKYLNFTRRLKAISHYSMSRASPVRLVAYLHFWRIEFPSRSFGLMPIETFPFARTRAAVSHALAGKRVRRLDESRLLPKPAGT